MTPPLRRSTDAQPFVQLDMPTLPAHRAVSRRAARPTRWLGDGTKDMHELGGENVAATAES